MNYELYGNGELIGVYKSRKLAAIDAFALMIDGVVEVFEILEIPDFSEVSTAA